MENLCLENVGLIVFLLEVVTDVVLCLIRSGSWCIKRVFCDTFEQNKSIPFMLSLFYASAGFPSGRSSEGEK